MDRKLDEMDIADILIVGAGLSGIGTAIKLRNKFQGVKVLILEKSDSIGGTWAKNNYPNLSCDIPSQLYQYSFALNPEWSTKYATQPEILAYFQRVASTHGLLGLIRLHHECVSAEWLDNERLWKVQVINNATGSVHVQKCRVLISAVGFLDIPRDAEDIENFELFSGTTFHSSKWDHSVDFKDKNILVIGNGCSANQFVPWLVQNTDLKSLVQVVRSAQWIAPKDDGKVSPMQKWFLRHIPFVNQSHRWLLALKFDIAFLAIKNNSISRILRNKIQSILAKYITQSAPAKYHDILIPSYDMGQKRPVMDHGYLKTLNDPRVQLIKSTSLTITGSNRVCDNQGSEFPVDIIILANGYKTQEPLAPMVFTGLNGAKLPDLWKTDGNSVSAYMGVMVPQFPNLFLLTGPNTLPTGHSTLFGIECSGEYIARLLHPLISSHAPLTPKDTAKKYSKITVKQEASAVYNHWLDARMKNLVYTNNKVRNWYTDHKTGKNTLIWPGTQLHFWWSRCIKWVQWGDFELE